MFPIPGFPKHLFINVFKNIMITNNFVLECIRVNIYTYINTYV